MKTVLHLFASVLMFCLGCMLLTFLAMFVVCAYCLTYPVLRLSPRDRRVRAGLDAAMALAALVAALRPEGAEGEAPEVTPAPTAPPGPPV